MIAAQPSQRGGGVGQRGLNLEKYFKLFIGEDGMVKEFLPVGNGCLLVSKLIQVLILAAMAMLSVWSTDLAHVVQLSTVKAMQGCSGPHKEHAN